VVLLATSKIVPFIHDPLSSFKSVVNIYAGDPTATLTFSWGQHARSADLPLRSSRGGIIQGCPFGEMLGVLRDTVKQMSKTIITMLGVLGCAKIMGYSGMIASVATFFVGTLGGFYPLVAPLLGALGTFVTGSGTSSEVLFGNVQLHAAQTLGINETWLVAANSLGTSAGKMIAPPEHRHRLRLVRPCRQGRRDPRKNRQVRLHICRRHGHPHLPWDARRPLVPE